MKIGSTPQSMMTKVGTSLSFKERQRLIVEAQSIERKRDERLMREEIREDYKDSHGWYDGDNDARSPLEADWEDIDE